MGNFKINRDSWHYKLNTFSQYNNGSKLYWESNHTNFCQYWRATLFSCFIFLVVVFGVSLVLGALIYLVITEPLEVFLIFSLIFGAPASVLIFYKISDSTKHFRDTFLQKETENLFLQKIITMKEKVCRGVSYD